jgi:Secretion system C-terminal sorting domain
MNKIGCFVVVFFTYCVCSGQNLVPNPSFEDLDSCPLNASNWLLRTVNYAPPWFQPTTGTSDYYNSCANTTPTSFGYYTGVPGNFFGYQYANTGIAYCGLFATLIDSLPYREYIEVKLLDTLLAGIKYYVSFYISLSDSSKYSTDDIGAVFSNDTIKNDTSSWNLPFFPQIENQNGFISDKTAWNLIKGEFIAQGGETFLTIGNFKDNFNTDTLYVGGSFFNTISYLGGYYYIDDVCVSTDSLVCFTSTGIIKVTTEPEILLFPNPFSDRLNISVKSSGYVVVNLYDIYSRNLFRKLFEISTSINTEQLAKGIYYYDVRNKNEVITKGVIIKD